MQLAVPNLVGVELDLRRVQVVQAETAESPLTGPLRMTKFSHQINRPHALVADRTRLVRLGVVNLASTQALSTSVSVIPPLDSFHSSSTHA